MNKFVNFEINKKMGSKISIEGVGQEDGHKSFTSTHFSDAIAAVSLFKSFERMAIEIEFYINPQESIVHKRKFKKGQYSEILEFIQEYEKMLL